MAHNLNLSIVFIVLAVIFIGLALQDYLKSENKLTPARKTWLHIALVDRNKHKFRNGTRYLCGKPISEKQCQHVLRHGYQRQRAAAAIELAMMKLGQPLFEVRAPGFRQQKMLGLK